MPPARRGIAALGAACALLAATSLAAEPAAEPPCDPIDAPRAGEETAPSADPGISGELGRFVGVAEGPIVSLAESSDEPVPQQVGGEALLVMPKRPDGTLAQGFELADGARLVDSYWSPVLCATVARVVGAPTDNPFDLVRGLPDDASLAPNHVYTTAAETVRAAPDPYRGLQHGLDRLGIDAARAVSTGAGVRVAVLDSAPQADHRDLGTVRIVPLPGGSEPSPAVHGTLTAGVIAAIAHNGFGIEGAAPDAQVLAIPVCTPLESSARDACNLFDVLRGLDLAWEQHAHVMNLSLVGPPSPLLERAVNRLDDLGAVIVAAAGNEGTEDARYPAAYPSVVGVGALDVDGVRYARSNRGPSAAIWAPGAEVLSTVPGDSFAFASGTSFAAAHVTGALAVLIGSGVAPEEARRALFLSAGSERAPPGAAAPAIAPLCGALESLGRACPPS